MSPPICRAPGRKEGLAALVALCSRAKGVVAGEPEGHMAAMTGVGSGAF